MVQLLLENHVQSLSVGKYYKNSFIWKGNNDDVTRGFLINIHDVGKSPHKYCFLIGTYEA